MYSMCPDGFDTYIIYVYICESCKSDMGKNKSLQSSYIFSLSGATNRYQPMIKILISELEYVDLWFTCVLFHCFTGGPHCPGWCGPDVHPSLPGSRMPVLRILMRWEVWAGILWCPEYRTYRNKRTLDKNYPKTNYRPSVMDYIYCIELKNTWIFFTVLIVKRVWLIGTPEYVVGECQAISCRSDTDWLPDCVNGDVYFVD